MMSSSIDCGIDGYCGTQDLKDDSIKEIIEQDMMINLNLNMSSQHGVLLPSLPPGIAEHTEQELEQGINLSSVSSSSTFLKQEKKTVSPSPSSSDMYFNFTEPSEESSEKPSPSTSSTDNTSQSTENLQQISQKGSSGRKIKVVSEEIQRKRQLDRAARNRESSRRAREKAKRRFRQMEIENIHLHQVIQALQIQNKQLHQQLNSNIRLKTNCGSEKCPDKKDDNYSGVN